jgi:tryptophan-rich sensory protein
MPWREWYDALAKPSWTPAPSTIGLIWSILYPIILVTFGFVFVQTMRGKIPWRVALPFAINLVANLVFSPIQFRMRNLPLASADILVVLGTIPWMMLSIWTYHRWVAVAQIPYLVWVSIATVLQLLITAWNR